MNGSTFWTIKYMNGSVFSMARYMNGVGFETLAHTPVPNLPLSYPPPTPRPRGFDFNIHIFTIAMTSPFVFVCINNMWSSDISIPPYSVCVFSADRLHNKSICSGPNYTMLQRNTNLITQTHKYELSQKAWSTLSVDQAFCES